MTDCKALSCMANRPGYCRRCYSGIDPVKCRFAKFILSRDEMFKRIMDKIARAKELTMKDGQYLMI